jgi:hypothetical protein
MWTPLRKAVARVGSLEALLPLLRDGRVLALHAGLFTWPAGGPVKTADFNIAPSWWKGATNIDPEAGRAVFEMDWFKALAIGIEIERAPLEALVPAQVGRKRGAKPSPVWLKIFAHFDAQVATKGQFPNLNSAAEAVHAWLKEQKLVVLNLRTIERGIEKNRPNWIQRN